MIRAPFRDNIDCSEIDAALSLVELARASPAGAWLLIHETAHEEWHNNTSLVVEELEREIKINHERRSRLIRAMCCVDKRPFVIGDDVGGTGLPERFRQRSLDLLTACHIVPQDDVHAVGAMYRVRKCLRPAQKGKQEAKDCEIFEGFLDICGQLNTASCPAPRYFVTSNSSDFGMISDSPIAEEAQAAGGQYLTNLCWALSLAKPASTSL